MQRQSPITYDFAEIERRARKLRGQAFARGTKHLITWVKKVTHIHPKGEKRPA